MFEMFGISGDQDQFVRDGDRRNLEVRQPLPLFRLGQDLKVAEAYQGGDRFAPYEENAIFRQEFLFPEAD